MAEKEGERTREEGVGGTIMDNKRTYEQVVTLRAVQSEDFMTADWYVLHPLFLHRASTYLIVVVMYSHLKSFLDYECNTCYQPGY